MEPNPYRPPQVEASTGGARRPGASGSAPFSIECGCGATIPVEASDAGGSKTCRCGRVERVPRLSQLRVAQGLAAHETNVRDTIARMIEERTLPWGACCAVTGMPTDEVMWFDIQCETTYLKNSKRWGILLIVVSLFLPFGWLLSLLGFSRLTEEGERLGRDIVIRIPLRVCNDSQAGLKRWASQRRLRRVLNTVPIYQELFRAHPTASILPR